MTRKLVWLVVPLLVLMVWWIARDRGAPTPAAPAASAAECIDQAKARNPRLAGLLSFTMVIAPAAAGRAIVAALEIRPDNQIADAELFECIRESSFALEGLKAPHDFDITMPIQAG